MVSPFVADGGKISGTRGYMGQTIDSIQFMTLEFEKDDRFSYTAPYA